MKYKCYFCGIKSEDKFFFSTLFEYRICKNCREKVANYLKERIAIDPT